jgi:hypothetical protein
VAKWAAFAVLCLVSLVPLGIEVAAYLAERQVNTILAELKAEGKPVTPAELVPPPVPDAENAALVYEEAQRKLQWNKGEEVALSWAAANWAAVVPLGRGMSAEQLERMTSGLGYEYKPSLSSPSESRFVPVEELPEAQRQPGEPTDSQVLAAAKKGLERNREALALIRKAAGMKKCRLAIDWSKGIAADLRQTAQFNHMARLLWLEAMVLYEEGRTDDALQAASDMLDVSNSLRDTPSLTALLVRMHIVNLALLPVQGILYDSTPSPGACRALTEKLAEVDLRGSAVKALEGERAIQLDMLQGIREGRPGFSAPPVQGRAHLGSGESPAGLLSACAVMSWLWPTWSSTDDTLFLLRGMGLEIHEAGLPFFEKDSGLSPELRRVQAQLGSGPSLFHPRPFSLIIVHIYDRIAERRAFGEANVGLARVALLLKAYRGEQGHYPESLDELARYEGKEVPLDPCSGQPFHYRRNGSGFILYSVGADGVDDGGKVSVLAGQEGPIPPLSSQKGADIMWVCKE